VGNRLGYLSTAGWLASAFRMAWGAARAMVRMARALDRMPRTRRALEEGEISLSAARVLSKARETDPEALSEAEGGS
jgi:HAMP domain-containing protein